MRVRLAIINILLLVLASNTMASELTWEGGVSTNLGVGLLACPDCDYLPYENRNAFDLGLQADITPGVGARAAITLRNENRPELFRLEDTADSRNIQLVRLLVTDAWVEGYDLLVRGLDLRVGAQTIRWGTGDGYSPSDRINPLDLSDPIYFDRRLAVPAVNARYHVGQFILQGVWVPFFVPSLLNDSVVDIVAGDDAADNVDLDDGFDLDGPEVDRIRTRVNTPDATLSESAFAFRALWAASVGDFSLGYLYGRDSLPQLSGEVIPENFFDGQTTDLIINLRYPRLQMISADARVPIARAWTAWADIALFLPSRTTVFISESRLRDLERLNAIDNVPEGGVVAEIQSGDPYTNIMLGVDNRFGRMLYMNLQYIHGFLFERNPGDLNHFLIAALRVPADDARISAELRAGGESTQQFDAFGFTSSLRLRYRHADALQFALVGTYQDGMDGTTLRLFRRFSEARVEVSARF